MSKSYRAMIAVLLSLLMAGGVFQSCKKENEGFRLDAFGPSGLERGGEVFFIGTGLNEVGLIEFPDGSVFDKNQFNLEGNEKITLTISADYPLCVSGHVNLKKADGTFLLTTISQFQVLTDVSVESVTPVGDEANPLIPGTEITVTGKVLKAVRAVIFANDFRLEVDPQNDNQFTFNLPDKAPSGKFKLEVEPRCDGDEATFVEVSHEISVLEPAITGIECPAHGSTELIPVNSEVVIYVSNPERVDVNENGKSLVEFTGKVVAEGVLSGDHITVAVPTGVLVTPERINVSVFSNGTQITSDEHEFTIIEPVITSVTSGAGFPPFISIKGENLLAVSNAPRTVSFVYENGLDIVLTTGVRGTPSQNEIQFTGNLKLYDNITDQTTGDYWGNWVQIRVSLQSGQIITFDR